MPENVGGAPIDRPDDGPAGSIAMGLLAPSRTSYRLRGVAVAGVLVLATACGSDGDPTADPTTPAAPTTATRGGTDGMDMTDAPSTDAMDDMDDMDMDMGGADGEPADASEASRTIDVSVANELAFDPDEFDVAEGEVVTFRIANSGEVEHEFVLGDEEAQHAMEEAMASGDGHEHSGDMTNAVTIHPGETAELTWRFASAGTVLVGCHVPGHYDAGMRGTVTVG